MKRPSRTVMAIVGAFVAFVIVEVIVWWPDAPKKKTENPPAVEQALVEPAPIVEAPPPAPPPPPAPVAREAQEIRKLEEDPESEQERALLSCFHRACGAPCLLRCDPQDGRCTAKGLRPGQCTADEECSYVLPAICPQAGAPQPGESPP